MDENVVEIGGHDSEDFYSLNGTPHGDRSFNNGNNQFQARGGSIGSNISVKLDSSRN